MRRVFFTVLVLAAGVATACGGGAIPRPAEPPPPVSEPRTRVDRAPETETPKLIAPPPAYGNKVVMAKAPTTTHLD